MLIGYARASTNDQETATQVAAARHRDDMGGIVGAGELQQAIRFIRCRHGCTGLVVNGPNARSS